MLKSEIATGVTVLSHRGWLAETPTDFTDAILANCHWREVLAGQAIQHAGDSKGVVTGVARGTVALSTALSTPDAPTMHIVHPGHWFGYVTLFGEAGLHNSIMARSDVVLAYFTHGALEQLLAGRPEWWRHVGRLGIMYGHGAINAAGDLMIRDSRRRCIAAMLRIADCRFRDPPGANAIEAPLSQDELAAVANLSRTSVSTILHDLGIEGLITIGYRSVILNDPAHLRRLVDDV